MNAPQPPYPHYPPPNAQYRQNVYVPPGAFGGQRPAPSLKTIILVAGIAQAVLLFSAVGTWIGAAVTETQELFLFGFGIFGVAYLAILAFTIAKMVWIYRMWAWFPPEQRHTNMWRRYISPGQAIGFLFIPYFNLYWMFVVFLGLAEILDRLRVAYPTSQPTPKGMALGTCVTLIVFFPLAPVFMYLFARQAEAIAADMALRAAAAPGMAAAYGG